MRSRHIIFSVLSLAVCLIVLAAVIPAQAREILVSVPESGEELSNGEILASVGIQAQGGDATSVSLYDQEWVLVSMSPGVNGAYQFQAVKPGAYHLVAYNDELDTWAAKDVVVQAGQTLQVALYPKKTHTKPVEAAQEAIAPITTAAADVLPAGAACGSAVSGDGRMLKIYPTFGANIVYMQCGRVVAKVQGAGCSCGGGGWNYTYDCPKSPPIYVNLPCHR